MKKREIILGLALFLIVIILMSLVSTFSFFDFWDKITGKITGRVVAGEGFINVIWDVYWCVKGW